MALDDDIAILGRVALFHGVDRDILRLIAFAADARDLRAGDVLFRQGEISDGGYIVARGTLTLTDGERVAGTAGPGTLVGEMALFTETRRPVGATAREPASVLRLSRVMFRRTLVEYPQFARKLQSELGARVRGLSDELAGIKESLKRIDER